MSQVWRCRTCGNETTVDWDGYPQPACRDCDPYRPMVKADRPATDDDGGPGTPFASTSQGTAAVSGDREGTSG